MISYNNNNFPESKTVSKFYALRTDEHLRACKELTPAQRDICYYLKTLDPDGDGLDINAKDIAEQLGLSKRTVSDALRVLNQLGWLEIEKKASIQVLINPQLTKS